MLSLLMVYRSSGRSWQARHPPRYAASLSPPSPNFGHSSSGGGAPQWAFWLLGFGIIGMALLTDFEVGVVRLIPVPVHLGIDVLGGRNCSRSPSGSSTSGWR